MAVLTTPSVTMPVTTTPLRLPGIRVSLILANERAAVAGLLGTRACSEITTKGRPKGTLTRRTSPGPWQPEALHLRNVSPPDGLDTPGPSLPD
jgi:hypothetical protein